MYIKKLKHWDESDWQCMFDNWDIEFTNRSEIKQILTLPSKISIENNFNRLKELWVINWIWANWMWKLCIKIITFLFPWVRYEWHDINYLLWGTDDDKIKCDYWLFKYSLLTIWNNFNLLSNIEIIFLFKELFMLIYFPLAILKLFILLIMWRLLDYFGWKAFYYHTEFKAG